MVKPIGNLIANLKPRDKVSAKTQARFASKSFAPPAADEAAPEQSGSKSRPVRFKKRKR